MRRLPRKFLVLVALCAAGCVVFNETRCDFNAATPLLPTTAGSSALQRRAGESCSSKGCLKRLGDRNFIPDRSRVEATSFASPPARSTDDVLFGCNGTRRMVREALGTRRESLKGKLLTWETNANEITHCPDMLSSLSQYASARDVPPLLHRIWECADIPERYEKDIMSWIDKADGMFVVLWTRKVRETFINKTLGPGHLDLYSRLLPGAYRADLFRYIIMYYFGGVYSDVDAQLHLSLRSVGHLLNGITLAVDIDAKRLLNGAILMSAQKQAIFLCAMGEVFDHSEHRLYFDSDLDISGPGILGECLRHILGKDDMIYDQKTAIEISSLGFHLLKSKFSDDGRHVVTLNDTHVFISLQPGGEAYDRTVRGECDPGEHYSVMYREKRVYNNRSP